MKRTPLLLGRQNVRWPQIRTLFANRLTSGSSPPVGEALLDSDVGYHLRAGGHSVEMFDWLKFLEFAERHLLRGSKR
jgi:hypothetical protein